ncbi:hypothetical protein OS493_009371 [Desmophyllum pertusum]|uniref:Uncharacterized protein n=1 Tax=Desmophyllum pertusum TaxID=174260 RepID=A0A9W9Z2L8_9CNID|nr:hypothetical protein OS493_009371 [Desmophyllum pertusum]
MAFKAVLLLLFLGLFGIFEIQAASLATDNDMWKDLDEASDGDKRNMEVDNTATDEYLPIDELAYADLGSDDASDTDYYNNALESRGVGCKDAFGSLCVRLGRSHQCSSRRHMRFAKKFCHGTCSQFCK